MLSQHSALRIIREGEDLVRTKTGDLVELLGVTNPRQRVKGLVVYADREDSGFGVRLIATRNTDGKKSLGRIDITAYIAESSRIIFGDRSESYEEGSKEFAKYDKMLKGVGTI